MDNLPPGPYYVDADDRLCDVDGEVLAFPIPRYAVDAATARALMLHLCKTANAHEAMVKVCQAAEPHFPTEEQMLDYASLNEGSASEAGVVGSMIRAALALADPKCGTAQMIDELVPGSPLDQACDKAIDEVQEQLDKEANVTENFSPPG